MASDDEDVPPLDDMSDLIEKMNNIRDMKHGETSVIAPVTTNSTTKTIAEASSSPDKTQDALSTTSIMSSSKSASPQQPSKPNTFGGFKKGFLFASKQPARKSQQKNAKSDLLLKKSTSPSEELPVIRPSPDTANQERRIPEVQEAMQSGIPLLDSKDWITEDLLKKMQSNPSLASKLMDPRFSQALTRMQSNPNEAFAMLQGDPDMQAALQDFCGMMGQHFTNLADQDETKPKKKVNQEEAIGLVERASTRDKGQSPVNRPSSEDEEKMKAILSRPDVKLALQDQQIQKIIGLLRTNPDAAQRELHSATPQLRSKLKVLVDSGLLAVG